jgi:hypothetical protein
MPTGYAGGFTVGIVYAEGKRYVNSKTELRRRTSTPRATLDIYYTDDKAWLRQRQLAVGVSLRSCSVPCLHRYAGGRRPATRQLFIRAQGDMPRHR